MLTKPVRTFLAEPGLSFTGVALRILGAASLESIDAIFCALPHIAATAHGDPGASVFSRHPYQ